MLLYSNYPNIFIDKNIKIRINKIKYSSSNSLNKKTVQIYTDINQRCAYHTTQQTLLNCQIFKKI